MVEFLVQSLQLGILNVIEAMNFTPEIVYPLYLSASSDRYSILEFCLKYIGILRGPIIMLTTILVQPRASF